MPGSTVFQLDSILKQGLRWWPEGLTSCLCHRAHALSAPRGMLLASVRSTRESRVGVGASQGPSLILLLWPLLRLAWPLGRASPLFILRRAQLFRTWQARERLEGGRHVSGPHSARCVVVQKASVCIWICTACAVQYELVLSLRTNKHAHSRYKYFKTYYREVQWLKNLLLIHVIYGFIFLYTLLAESKIPLNA